MTNAFNYLFTSWILEVEEKYPLVFSVVGREYVKLNVYWYHKVRNEVWENSQPEIEKVLQILKSHVEEKYQTIVLLKNKGKLGRFGESGRSGNIVGSFSMKILEDVTNA
ncbi:hypothetical protein JA1_000195 [Spathaspora sp. JA1]|nr:hypothetical protein JA1_000195 [Spathaspora sp. JA1]